MKGLRSRFYTSYEAESGMLPTITQKIFLGALLVYVMLIPLGQAPFMQDVTPFWLTILSRVCIFIIAGLGLNLLTGVAGQVSLGHSFFMGLGAYSAIVLGSEAGPNYIGFDLPMWLWLPGAAIIPAIIGAIIAPVATRVRGLYLAFVTLGLVFLGIHFFRSVPALFGDPEGGREMQHFEFQWWRESPATLDFEIPWTIAGQVVHPNGVRFFFMFLLAVVAVLVHKNLLRTRTGRAWQSIRDRDIAAEVMGIAETRYKTLAFAISSGFAGAAGALLTVITGTTGPEAWNLNLAVEMIAIVLIGGAGTTAGIILGALFVVILPEMVETATFALADFVQTSDSFLVPVADFIVGTDPSDFGIISLVQNGPGLAIFDFNNVLYGLLIILFLIFEPLGLYGIWINIRNYWKGWPFTY